MLLFLYLLGCLALCFFPVETYISRWFIPAGGAKSTGAILVWKPWLELAINSFFFLKGLLICLAGRFLYTEVSLFIFLGFLIALLSEAYSPLKKSHRTLALGLGFLTGYQLWAVLVYLGIALLLLCFIHYRIPVLVAAAGIYPLTIIYLGDSYHIASALVLFILLCVQYLRDIQDYFNGTAKNILAELKH